MPIRAKLDPVLPTLYPRDMSKEQQEERMRKKREEALRQNLLKRKNQTRERDNRDLSRTGDNKEKK